MQRGSTITRKRAKLEAVGLTLCTALALLGSIALVLPGASAAGVRDEPSGWIQAWTAAGCEVRAIAGPPEEEALEAWSVAGFGGDPHAVRFVHPAHGTVALALVDRQVGVVVYEAGRQARLLHPALGTADLGERGHFYVAAGDAPIERRKLPTR